MYVDCVRSIPLVGLLPSPFPPISAGPILFICGLPLPVLRFYLATSSCNGVPSTSRETLTPDFASRPHPARRNAVASLVLLPSAAERLPFPFRALAQ